MGRRDPRPPLPAGRRACRARPGGARGDPDSLLLRRLAARLARRGGDRGLTPSVHIVVVNWNTGDYLRSCLSSIASADRDGAGIARVTVVDNDSRDGSTDGLEDLRLPLQVVHNSHNVGFAAACNQGAAGSTADYLLFLNPDTRLFSDTLTVTMRFMESERAAGVGICGVS